MAEAMWALSRDRAFSRAWACFPFEAQLNPAEIDLSEVMDHRGVLARFCCQVEVGAKSFRQILTEKNYSLTSLDPKARNKTRQGLEKCTYGQEDARDLGADGILICMLRLCDVRGAKSQITMKHTGKNTLKPQLSAQLRPSGLHDIRDNWLRF